jgi:hypothetical protein
VVRRGTLRVGLVVRFGPFELGMSAACSVGQPQTTRGRSPWVYWTQEKKPVRLRKAPGGLPLDIRQNTDGSYDRVKQVTAH